MASAERDLWRLGLTLTLFATGQNDGHGGKAPPLMFKAVLPLVVRRGAKFARSLYFAPSLIFVVRSTLSISCQSAASVCMKLLRAKGLPLPHIQHICQALIISRIIYAVSAREGFSLLS